MSAGDLTNTIREAIAGTDERAWPGAAINALTRAKIWAHTVPTKHGGTGATSAERLDAYERVAAGSLSVALILTQHDAACELLRDCENAERAAELLPACARGEALLTVGISQLTTSRQTTSPAMRATATENGFRFTGVMPWVTSGPHADYVVGGAVLDDGQQVLACLPTKAQGIHIAEPFELMALGSSWTCSVTCDGTRVPTSDLLRGPMSHVLARRAPVKGLTVTSVGIGLARAMFDLCEQHVATLPGAAALLDETIRPCLLDVRARLFAAARTAGDAEAETPAAPIRAEVNDLLGRLAATLMTLAKGSGYVASHPAQRLVREAMFFFVWSATNEVRAGTLDNVWRDRTRPSVDP